MVTSFMTFLLTTMSLLETPACGSMILSTAESPALGRGDLAGRPQKARFFTEPFKEQKQKNDRSGPRDRSRGRSIRNVRDRPIAWKRCDVAPGARCQPSREASKSRLHTRMPVREHEGLPEDYRDIFPQFARRASHGIQRPERGDCLRKGDRNSFGSFANEGLCAPNGPETRLPERTQMLSVQSVPIIPAPEQPGSLTWKNRKRFSWFVP
jgi:hypothetical protein